MDDKTKLVLLRGVKLSAQGPVCSCVSLPMETLACVYVFSLLLVYFCQWKFISGKRSELKCPKKNSDFLVKKKTLMLVWL